MLVELHQDIDSFKPILRAPPVAVRSLANRSHHLELPRLIGQFTRVFY